MRTALLIAFHFPPILGSSGVQRTLRFAQHLPKFGWRPIVLTIDAKAYEAVSEGGGNDIPPDLEVHRAFGRDAARSLSILGRYPRALALPDRWAIWKHWAVPVAMRIVSTSDVDVLWSTFPIATAQQIGLEVAQRTGLPWVAEFRDPMWQGDYPEDATVNRAWLKLERSVFERADSVVVATPGAARMYTERYPALSTTRVELIENGYDEETFQRAEADIGREASRSQPSLGGRSSGTGPVCLVHSGKIYPSERDPSQLFAALAGLKAVGAMSASDLRIILRATGEEARYRALLDKLGIGDLVSIEPAIDYLSALREMLTVDGLLILQAANCNAQVPAKLYEYLRARRPILALTDPSGDTARVLFASGVGRIAPLDSASAIAEALLAFIGDVRTGAWRCADSTLVAGFSRQAQTALLADRFNEAVVSRSRTHG